MALLGSIKSYVGTDLFPDEKNTAPVVWTTTGEPPKATSNAAYCLGSLALITASPQRQQRLGQLLEHLAIYEILFAS
jgi:hypothetical protein